MPGEQDSSRNTNNTNNPLDAEFRPSDSNTDIDSILSYLRSIDDSLQDILKNGGNISQSAARDRRYDAQSNRFYRDRQSSSSYSRTRSSSRSRSSGKSFTDGIEDALRDAILGKDFNQRLRQSLNGFADSLGVQLSDIPNNLGRQLGDQIINATRRSNIGNSILNSASDSINWLLNKLGSVGQPRSTTQASQSQTRSQSEDRSSSYDRSRSNSDDIGDQVSDIIQDQVSNRLGDVIKNKAGSFISNLAGKGGTIGKIASKAGSFFNLGSTAAAGVGEAAATTAAAGTATTAATTTAATAATTTAAAGTAGTATSALTAGAAGGPVGIVAAIAAMVLIEAITEALGPMIEGFQEFWGALSKAANRNAAERAARQENEQKRWEADLKSMVEEPFEILKDAANEMYEVWDTNLRKINGTQGYTADQLQSLIGDYAERLRESGLSRVVSSADITESLAKVLDSGMSGAIAEEFAYHASILNAAIPTQDFFNYASTYVSLAANAQKQGMSQAEAINYANKQLDTFASSVLYASRQLTGGFTTGLQDAQSLFESSVKIAQTSRTGNPAEIGGVLTSISAIVGGIAPDLANELVDSVVKAATGGNSSQIVALRSLAGINASNTEFLQALAKDPQKVFYDLFSGLADMQNMSEGAYMEVAEGLSSIFGISMDAIARVDFNYLANAIANMNVNTASLEENIRHLASGETTTNAEQLRMQQINQYMIDEGLAYVLDNEVARSIQEHMWDEQLANEIMENSFAVEIQGAALQLLEGIRQTIDNIISLLNPFSWFNKIMNVFTTSSEAVAQDADLRQLLELGKVGRGNAQSLYQLTTRGVDLNVTPDIVTLMGGVSAYQLASGYRKTINSFFNPTNSLWNAQDKLIGSTLAGLQYSVGSGFASRGNAYTWGGLSKSQASSIMGSGIASGTAYSGVMQTAKSSEDVTREALESAFQKLTDEEYIRSFVEQDKSYNDWVSTAKNFGITDMDKALETVGATEDDLKMMYQQYETQRGAQQQYERYMREEQFWDNVETNQTTIIDLTTAGNDLLTQLLETTNEFKQLFNDYFIDHIYYDKSGYDYTDVQRIKDQQSSGEAEAIYALASALTQNTVDLRDPTVQTNAILAQILLVVKAIMQQNNTTGKLTLPDALMAMATDQYKLENA